MQITGNDKTAFDLSTIIDSVILVGHQKDSEQEIKELYHNYSEDYKKLYFNIVSGEIRGFKEGIITVTIKIKDNVSKEVIDNPIRFTRDAS